jgi:hypothetical protein
VGRGRLPSLKVLRRLRDLALVATVADGITTALPSREPSVRNALARTMEPVDIRRLSWRRPDGCDETEFDQIRARLEGWLACADAVPIYKAKRRAIYRADDPALGSLAVKEIRSASWLREVAFRHVLEHPGLREFGTACAFASRGGATPPCLGAALEHDAFRVRRVFLFTGWADGAQTLSAFLRGLGREPEARVFVDVAESLIRAARLGLVHRRHSAENLLVLERGGRSISRSSTSRMAECAQVASTPTA